MVWCIQIGCSGFSVDTVVRSCTLYVEVVGRADPDWQLWLRLSEPPRFRIDKARLRIEQARIRVEQHRCIQY